MEADFHENILMGDAFNTLALEVIDAALVIKQQPHEIAKYIKTQLEEVCSAALQVVVGSDFGTQV